MFNKYLLLFISLVVTIYIPTTNAYGFCTCYCCDGPSCDPIFEGNIKIPSCDGSSCFETCKKTFPLSCASQTTGVVKPDCKDVEVVNETTTPLTTPSTPWPLTTKGNITITTTTPTTTSTENTTTTSNTTSETTSTTTTTDTASTNSTHPTSPPTTNTTMTTSVLTQTTTTAQSPTTTSKHVSGAFILRESPSFIALIVTSILLIIKVML
ncbi:unnamed protein product [Rotaria sordida]|uniref:Uncharacterized protein n=1 Tax=Rotaria sordida TaxID=392033 RepID=A0A814E910_9BILA|nr:unnamed protein product [Rotaria sordida]CAF3616273.1 unnamed protein product [Rotaria sordida]